MEIKYPVTEIDKYYILLLFLSPIKPFSELRRRELQVYSQLLRYRDKYKQLSLKEQNKLIFDYDVRQEIAEIYGMSVDGVYNVVSSLKKRGLVDEDGIVERYANLISLEKGYLKINFMNK